MVYCSAFGQSSEPDDGLEDSTTCFGFVSNLRMAAREGKEVSNTRDTQTSYAKIRIQIAIWSCLSKNSDHVSGLKLARPVGPHLPWCAFWRDVSYVLRMNKELFCNSDAQFTRESRTFIFLRTRGGHLWRPEMVLLLERLPARSLQPGFHPAGIRLARRILLHHPQSPKTARQIRMQIVPDPVLKSAVPFLEFCDIPGRPCGRCSQQPSDAVIRNAVLQDCCCIAASR